MSKDAEQSIDLRSTTLAASFQGSLEEASRAEPSHPDPVPKDFFLIPVPKYLRHKPGDPASFSLSLNIVFAVATTFSEFLTRRIFPNGSNE